MMVKVVCDECGKEFEKYHLYIRSDKNYCTRECFHAARKHNRRGYIVKDDMVIININKGKTVTVDLIDRDLADYNWNLIAGYAGKGLTYMHRLILERMLGRELVDSEIVDHINNDPLDNRRCNLRLSDHSTNARNGKCHSDSIYSGYKGVCFDKSRNKWIANIYVDGHGKFLGYHANEKDAARAYNKAALEYFGEFAKLNEVDDEEDIQSSLFSF